MSKISILKKGAICKYVYPYNNKTNHCTYLGRIDAGTTFDRERTQDSVERRQEERAEMLIKVQDELHSKGVHRFICITSKTKYLIQSAAIARGMYAYLNVFRSASNLQRFK